MTCKTHTILAALRILREEGFNDKIDPAMICELTGIEKPGTTLCALRKKGFLIDAGETYLPAARGKTKANLYTINPKSDLIPKEKYNVAHHKKKEVLMNSKTSDIRRAIKSYNGKIFSTSQVRKDADMYSHTYQRLLQLRDLGEIEMLEMVKTGGRDTMTWREIKINESLIFKESVVPVDAKESSNPWAKVWPEFFSLPKLSGTVRSFCEVA